jgi:hypothetical protein
MLNLKNHAAPTYRKYLGLLPDGSINKEIPPFIDRRTLFWEQITKEECEKQKFPHNMRSRKTDGFYCNDCGSWIAAGTDDYERYK